jgi:hypothetical protein
MMGPNDQLDCAIYLQPSPKVEIDSVAALTAEALGAQVEKGPRRATIIFPRGEIEFRNNDGFNLNRAVHFPDGFLSFPLIVEIFARWTDENERNETVGRLLERFWSNGWPAVAACDYEDQLPRRGGYKDREIFQLFRPGASSAAI